MNFKYLMILSLMFIISIGAVSAAEDVNSTVESINIDDIPVDSIIMDGQIGTNDNNEYTITNDNYETYFNNMTGDILEDAPFSEGDVLKFDNVSDKYFVINKNLTILPAGSNITLTNVGFNFVPGSEGATVDGITIENNVTQWVNNNKIQLIPILIQHTKSINVINSYVHSSANFAIALANATYCNIRNNTLSTIKENAGAWGGKSTFLVSVSSYNNVSNNNILSTSANLIYFLPTIPGVTLNSGISEFNVFENNYLNGTSGMNSAMCWGIRIMANDKYAVGQNTFAGNLVSDAMKCVSIQGNVEKIILTGNTFVNTKTAIEVGSTRSNATFIIEGNTINSDYIGILLGKETAVIEKNMINATGYGIQINGANNATVFDNLVISDKDYGIYVSAGTNNSITNNYIISKTYYGNNAVTTKINDTIIENNTPTGASIDVDVIANINENATIKINVLPFDAYGNVTIKFNGKSETINFNASQTIVHDLGVLGAGDYNVTVIYNGNAKYNSTNITKTFSIGKISDYNITLNNTEIIAGENSTLVIILPEDATGVVNVTIGKDSYKVNVTGGVATVKINSLIAGDYKVNVTYSGDKTYEVSNNVFNLTVTPMKVDLNISDIVMIYHDGTKMVAVLTDIKGNPIANATVYFTINGKTYAKSTDANGTASMGLNLVSGVYGTTVSYNGSEVYNNVSKNITVTINPTIVADDLVKMYQNDTRFHAKFTDSTGKAIANKEIRFNINGVFYTKKTDKDGMADLGIMLRPGSYILTAYNPVTGEEKGFNITCLLYTSPSPRDRTRSRMPSSA